ncbi:MAG: crotonase/enoyl-CoA hydratase family protein [Gammaproteobacteria bacterium]
MPTTSHDLLDRRLRNIRVERDDANRAVWVELSYIGRPCFSAEVLADIGAAQHAIRQIARTEYENRSDNRLLYQVITSGHPRTFSLGGDLAYFIELIESHDRERLLAYAEACIEIQHAAITHYDVPFTTIALVQGEALGGGFEAALSNNVLIAEESARFGFPEINYGMFPGMGAISLLSRKVAPAVARRLIMDRRVHTAGELYDIGVVDVLAADGEGRGAVLNYLHRHAPIVPGLHGFQAAVDRVMPVSYEELYDIVEHWVDTALQLSEKNRRLMAYFARAQENRVSGGAIPQRMSVIGPARWSDGP